MAEKPILFNTDMARAILEGRKTQTRRPITPQTLEKFINLIWNANENIHHCPYRVGDTLWVRETWAYQFGLYWYKAGPFPPNTIPPVKWKPSIHMPKEASRIKLLVKSVRVERLQEITEDNAKDEGVKDPYEYQHPDYYNQPHMRGITYAISAFAGLWDSIYAKQGSGWDKNPWVWVIEFERVDK